MNTEAVLENIKNHRPKYSSWVHEGYLDGILGLDPNPRLEGAQDYDTGWLNGCEDRTNPEKLKVLVSTDLKRGTLVSIPKGTKISTTSSKGDVVAGRTYTVKAWDITPVTQANFDRHAWQPERDQFVPPKPARVIWIGAGGYWYEANLTDVQVLAAEAPQAVA